MIKELFFHPNLCLDCHEEWISEYHLCSGCLEKLEKIHGRNRILSETDCVFPFYYGGEIKDLLIRFKFRKESYLFHIFAEILYEYIKEYKEFWDEIITVPYTKKKIRLRGYEPVNLIGEELSKKLRLKYSRACVKIKDTEDQHLLKAEERIDNLDSAFSCNHSVKGKRMLLVDDIMTSGATLKELSKTLLNAGAKSVDCLVIASERREEKGFWFRYDKNK